ncbi:hypothetical protein QBC35DRAFT_488130 [Podospora australis]|uniref:O-acyltransferase n=1 Tax=Podospora australis TaxID=1536484 RepID=A0AAN6WZJ2_9PEZI|nr:hypothetical protein QBC35DRAFT_488130 [Podospora australis]
MSTSSEERNGVALPAGASGSAPGDKTTSTGSDPLHSGDFMPSPPSGDDVLTVAREKLHQRQESGTTTTSEEDYDDLSTSTRSSGSGIGPGAAAVNVVRRKSQRKTFSEQIYGHSQQGQAEPTVLVEVPVKDLLDDTASTTPSSLASSFSVSQHSPPHHRQNVLHLQPNRDDRSKRQGKFTDLVFSRKFSAFDGRNTDAANSPFHGFFTLFWMGVFLFVVKIGADNWRIHGNPLGTNEIMKGMFGREVLIMLFADGVMCASTGVSFLLQKLVQKEIIGWDRSGWILQNIWQTFFIGSAIGLTLLRDWPWTHTVFFVMHAVVMLMKQHSYAFYNGYLSEVFRKRKLLLGRLKELERIQPTSGEEGKTQPMVSEMPMEHLARVPSAKERRRSISCEKIPDVDRISRAIGSGEPLDEEQIKVFERVLKWEVDALTDELKGKATTVRKAYPNNLTVFNHYEYVVLPTVVYELEYPRSDSINWYYAAEKMAACFGIIFVMIMISQAFIYPVVMDSVRMKEEGVALADRFKMFPWMLLDLIFPFMMEYLLSWYLIWETILNFLAELTYFADRCFYDAWWNCVSWDQFARDWNRPVHNFLLRHVYHSSISAMKVNKHTATLITFFLSACVHELVMWCIFKKLRGYLLFLQMCQLPLVRLSRTKWLRNRATLGNIIFWLGIFTGPSVLCSLYLIL